MRRPLFVLAVSALLAACSRHASFEVIQMPPTPAALQKYWTLPEFTLTERSGQPLRSSDLAGKIWVADFFYTTCPGPCPMVTSHFSELQKSLGPAPDARFVSISVDPEKDTPAVLNEYAAHFKAGGNWYFCTGDRAAIFKLAHDGFKLPIAEGTPESGPVTHSTRLVLVDKSGTVRGFYEGANADGIRDLTRDFRRLQEEP